MCYIEYENYLKNLSDEGLEEELNRQSDRENAYANSRAAYEAAIFFNMMSFASSEAWKINACKRELARRRGR